MIALQMGVDRITRLCQALFILGCLILGGGHGVAAVELLGPAVKLLGGWTCRHDGLAALCCSCYVVIARCLGSGLWAQFRSSSCLAAECNRDSVVKSVGGIVQAVAVSSDCYKCPLTEKGHSSVVKLLGGQGSFESLCASVQRPLSWFPPSAVIRLELSRVPHEPCRRVRRGAGSSLPCAALPSLSESSMAAEFLRV